MHLPAVIGNCFCFNHLFTHLSVSCNTFNLSITPVEILLFVLLDLKLLFLLFQVITLISTPQKTMQQMLVPCLEAKIML